MNSCVFAGRIGGDAETRYTKAGKPVTGFSLAVDEYAGEGQRATLWVKCSIFGDRGEKLAPYLKKGSSVTVSGQVGIDQWTSNNGEVRADLKLFVREVTLQGSKGDSAPRGNQHGQGQNDDDSEIPF